MVKNLTLANTIISGSYYSVGGIAGEIRYGFTLTNCTVLSTTINTSSSGGAVVGVIDGGTLHRNYYLNCSVRGETSNVGTSKTLQSSTDVDDVRLALPVNLPASLAFASYSDHGIVIDGQLYAGASESLSLVETSTNHYAYFFDKGTIAKSSVSTYKLTINAGITSAITVIARIYSFWGIGNGADGTAEHPYVITSTEEMDFLAFRVNEWGEHFADTYFKLGNDITYDPNNLTVDHDGDGTNESNYTAIGGNTSFNIVDQYFSGNFDGCGYTISGIRLYSPNSYQGIFGYIIGSETSSAEVKNLILDNAEITGRSEVGGIVGSNNKYRYSGSYINGGTVVNCHVTNSVTIHAFPLSTNTEFGGIVGKNSGTVSYCTSSATFSMNAESLINVGGVVGANSGRGTNIVSHCTSTATFIFGATPNLEQIGGVVGINASYDSGTGIVNNCLAIGITIPSNEGEQYGIAAVVGSNRITGTLDHNYYYDCNILGENSNIGYGIYYFDYDLDDYIIYLGDQPENDGAVPLGVLLYDDGTGNMTTIADHLDEQNSIALYGRTLYHDGTWNTLCLPFGVSDFGGTPLEDADVCELESATLADGVVTLNFGNPVTSIDAGTPYIVHWPAGGNDIPDPVFSAVTITATEPQTVSFLDGAVSFIGNFVPFADTTGLLLDAHNTNNGAFHAALQVPEGCEVVYHFPSNCIAPYGFEADNVTATTTDLHWNIPMPADSYTVRYRTAEVPSLLELDYSSDFGDWTLRDCSGNTYIDHNSILFYPITPLQPQYLISPLLDVETDGLTLQFYNMPLLYNPTTITTFQIGFSSTDDATESFTFGEETTYTQGDDQWHLYSVPVPAGTRYICWKVLQQSGGLAITKITLGEYIPAGFDEAVLTQDFENGLDDWIWNGGALSDGFDFAHSGNHYIGIVNGYLISPMLEETEGLGVDFVHSKHSQFIIGFSSTNSELDSFTFGDTISSTSSGNYWRHYSTSIPDGTKYICWKNGNFDDIRIYREAWSLLPVEGEGPHVSTTLDGTEVSTTLTGLTPGTGYELQLKSDCDEAEWSEMVNITTNNIDLTGDTLIIYTATAWNLFCDALQDNATYNRFIGKTVKLGADISVTRMAGSAYHDFMGTFDGQGHTLTVAYGTAEDPVSEDYAAPFRNVEAGANIHSLNVAGHIYTSNKYAGGIVGNQYGNNIVVNNCRSGVIIHSSKNGDGTHGGIVANQHGGSLTVSGCVYDGRMLTTNGTTLCGGLVGYHSGGTCTISDCLYAPATDITLAPGETYITNGATLCRNYSDTPVNCYYTETLGTAQGKLAIANPAVSPAGEPTATYDVSDLAFYSNGVQFGEVFYCDPEAVVTQTITLASGVNWVSFNVETTLDDLKAALVATGGTNIVIKAKSSSTTWNGHRWLGSLNGFNVNQMFMIILQSGCEITLQGMPMAPAAHPLTISNGTNWIGYPLNESMTLTEAFAGFPANQDVVKSKTASATWNGHRWVGQLNTLQPGQGYIYQSKASGNKTFTFPTDTK